MSPIPNYVVGTLARERTPIFDQFLEHVRALEPPPVEIIVASENQWAPDPWLTMVSFKPHIPQYVPIGSYGEKLLRIGEGREAVRSYVCDRGYDWLLFIDSDVLVPPCTYRVMDDVARRANVGCVQNLVRGSGAVYFGCILVHRDILRMVRFYSLAWGADTWISEDWIFFNILKWHNFFSPGRFKWVRQAVVPITHYHGPQDVRGPLPTDLSRLNISDS